MKNNVLILLVFLVSLAHSMNVFKDSLRGQYFRANYSQPTYQSKIILYNDVWCSDLEFNVELTPCR